MTKQSQRGRTLSAVRNGSSRPSNGDLKAESLPPLVWYDVLIELKGARKHGLRPYELQERMLLAQYNLSRLVDRMVKKGFVRRERSVSDGRGFVLHINPLGLQMQLDMWEVYRRSISQHFAVKLTSGELKTLRRLMKQLSR